jgi:hypothetical protein
MTRATLGNAAWMAASRRDVGSGILRGTGAGGVRKRGVPDFLLLMSSRGVRVLWVVRLPPCFLWGVLRVPMESASLAYASSFLSFFHSPLTHSLVRTFPHPRNLPASPATLFSLLPLLPKLPRPHTPSSRTVLPAAPALFPSCRRSPDFLRKRELLPDQSRRAFPSVLQLGPSQRFPQGGCWPIFPTRSPGSASRPRRVLSSGHSLPVGILSGGVVILLPPINCACLRGG